VSTRDGLLEISDLQERGNYGKKVSAFLGRLGKIVGLEEKRTRGGERGYIITSPSTCEQEVNVTFLKECTASRQVK